MIAIDKYVICRATVTTVLIGLVIGFVWSFGAQLTNIVWQGLIEFVLLLPVILLNIIWYDIAIRKRSLVDESSFSIVLIVIIAILNGLGVLAEIVPTSETVKNPVLPFNIWHVVPLIILSLNLLFILVYYTVGKRTCKLIYGTKKESEEKE